MSYSEKLKAAQKKARKDYFKFMGMEDPDAAYYERKRQETSLAEGKSALAASGLQVVAFDTRAGEHVEFVAAKKKPKKRK